MALTLITASHVTSIYSIDSQTPPACPCRPRRVPSPVYMRVCICTCVYRYVCTCVHPSIHTYIHAYTHIQIHTYIHTYIHRHTQTHICTPTHTHIHTNTKRAGPYRPPRSPPPPPASYGNRYRFSGLVSVNLA